MVYEWCKDDRAMSRTITSEFESGLRQGLFCIPYCKKCKKTVWPPSDFCSICMGYTSLEGFKNSEINGYVVECVEVTNVRDDKGKNSHRGDKDCIIHNGKKTGNSDYSSSRTTQACSCDATGDVPSFLCLVDLKDGIRVIARMRTLLHPVPKSPVRLKRCGIGKDNRGYDFEVEMLS